jgi:translation initiation factor IF-1
MAKNDYVTMEGAVTEVLPGNNYRIKLNNEHVVLAYLSGKMKQHKIHVIEGDRVDVEVNVYDHTRGRISFRYK